MTRAEKHVRKFNRLNGKPARKEKLCKLHVALKKDITSKKIDAHVPYGVECLDIEKRLAKAIKKINGHQMLISLKPVALQGKNIIITQTARGPEVVKAKKAIHYHHEDITMLYGLQEIQDDSDYAGTSLDGLSNTTYQVITDRILELIKQGGLIWRKPWNNKVNGSTDLAHNYVTKNIYRAGNYYLNFLSFGLKVKVKGKERVIKYDKPYYFTFKQITDLGGKVIKGEAGWPVIYFKWLYKDIKKDKLVPAEEAIQGGKLKPGYEKFPGLFYYNVFNYAQTEGLKIKIRKSKPKTEDQRIEAAEKIITGMPKAPPIRKGTDRAFYSPRTDYVEIPPLSKFKNEQNYYSVTFHELVHSTGHQSRIGRDLTGKFGSKSYAFEELIAELGASFLCGDSGILYYTMKNSAAYIESWSSRLAKEMKEDNKFFIRAASAAQAAADFMLDRKEADYTLPAEKEEKKKARKVRKVQASRPPVEKVKPVPKKKVTAPQAPVPDQLSGVVDASAFKKIKYRKFPLTGKYKEDFAFLNSDNQVMIWGPPGSGKTVYLLKLAQYLAQDLGLKVLFVENEEWGRSTWDEKIEMFNIGHQNLKFAEDFQQLEKQGYKVTDFDAVFLDSVQSLGMDLPAYKAFVKKNFGRLFFPIIQSTKDGDFRGGKDWEHEVDIAGEIRNRKLILRKNRLDPDFEIKREQLLVDDLVKEKQKSKLIAESVKNKIDNKPKDHAD
jgi:antirestriction protein ArdC